MSAPLEDAGAAAGSVDGRAGRSVRTRHLVVEVFLDLLVEGEPQPTAQQVSDRSGVSMRSIFRLFEDVEAMHTTAIAAQLERVAHLIVPLATEGPLGQRTTALVDSRAKLFETISPVRRFAVRLAPTSRPIRADLEQANTFLCAQLEHLFAAELGRLPPARRAQVRSALDAVTSWETWERLRGIQQVSVRGTKRIVTDSRSTRSSSAGRATNGQRLGRSCRTCAGSRSDRAGRHSRAPEAGDSEQPPVPGRTRSGPPTTEPTTLREVGE